MSESLRIDKWLWFARFYKTRTLAGRAVGAGRIRVNGETVSKSHQPIRPGDVLTFPLGPYVRVIRVDAVGARRGPAPEAQGLYTDLDPPIRQKTDDPDTPEPVARREPGSGRPTKTERRATDRLRGQK